MPRSDPPPPGRPESRKALRSGSRLRRLADAIGSLPFGIAVLVALLLYSWIGSAGTQPFYDWFPRQSLEKTEMEWFAWWPFELLLALLCLSLILVTVRRVRLNLPNLGVWMVHVGILVLVLGCTVYFGLKVEGDVAVYRREAVLSAGGPSEVLTLRLGAETLVRGPDDSYRVVVSDINPAYELLTGTDKGKRTFCAQLTVEPGPGEQREPAFIRQILVGYPEYTEDVVPGRGRAIKVLGRRLVDERLRAELRYAPADRIFLVDRPALHLRPAGGADWREVPLRGLPRYHEALASAEDAFVLPGEPPVRYAPIDLRPRLRATPGELGGIQVRITGYLPYGVLTEVPGGRPERPLFKPRIVPLHERDGKAGPAYSLLQVELTAGGRSERFWLEYSHYTYPTRSGYFPRRVLLADGREIEAVYSRETLPLPAPVALEEFRLETWPGGRKERDFESLVRFREEEGWSSPTVIHSNHPTEHGGWWFFQSSWDPPDGESGYGGMAYTGLGVGNRQGVGIMLLGGLLSVAGSLWAFYVKPALLRRRLTARRSGGAIPPSSTGRAREPGEAAGPAPLSSPTL